MSLNLSGLGLELEHVRRARRQSISAISDDSASVSAMSGGGGGAGSVSAESSPDARPAALGTSPPTHGAAVASGASNEAHPYSLCLLCFSRAPSAVLLPCCHLNLCHLCAPLLMHKSREATTRFPEHALPSDPEPRTDRVPFNVALSRAVANHPKSRRMSMGGYRPPAEGVRGGELRARDVLAAAGGGGGVGEDAGGAGVGLSGLAARGGGGGVGQGGEVRLELDGPQAATCLVCRQGVSGWLRVYTG